MDDPSHLLDSLKSVILSKRKTVDKFQHKCYVIILEIANKIIINESKRRTDTFQKIITMFPQNQYLIIFKKVLTIPLLDHLLTQLNVRFDSVSVIV